MKQGISRSRMHGLSMVEVMVSLVIGLVVVGAVMVSYLSTNKLSRQQVAYAEMNENAQIALGILTKDLLLAGYAQPSGYVPVGGVTTMNRTYTGRPVFGCDTGFANANASPPVTCNASGGSPAIEMVYQADTLNTVPTAANLPSDCLGNTMNPTAGALNGVDYFIVYNRYYLDTGSSGRSELHCASNTKDGSLQPVPGQPLVDNVEAMKFWYGEDASPSERRVVRYVTAANLVDNTFARVIAVKVCVLMRSSEAVLDSAETGNTDTDTALLGYKDCDSVTQATADGHLRRAYFTTVTLRNKMAF